MKVNIVEIVEEMNKQASDWVDEVHPHVSYRAWHNYHKTKFAELILNECINQCEKTRQLVWTVPLKDDEQVTAVICMIKQHFGVEE